MSKLNWIGSKEAKAAAKKGAEAALECVIEHWWQLSHRPKSIKNAFENRLVDIAGFSCALCSLYKGICSSCPAKGKNATQSTCCRGLWHKAKYHFAHDYENNYSAPNRYFTKAALKVWQFLKTLRKDL